MILYGIAQKFFVLFFRGRSVAVVLFAEFFVVSGVKVGARFGSSKFLGQMGEKIRGGWNPPLID